MIGRIVEAAIKTSYRRAVKEIERDGKLPVAVQTAHDWVMRTQCDEIELSSQVVGNTTVQIMPDGTGFKGEASMVRLAKGT